MTRWHGREGNMSEIVKVTMEKGTTARLKALALELGRQYGMKIRWTTLAKRAIERLLLDEGTEPIYGLQVVRRTPEDQG
jgi:hypothetical protein